MTDIAAVDDTFKRIQSHKGVIGVCVINADGIAIKSTFENDLTVQYAALVSHFIAKSRSVVQKLDSDVSRLNIHAMVHMQPLTCNICCRTTSSMFGYGQRSTKLWSVPLYTTAPPPTDQCPDALILVCRSSLILRKEANTALWLCRIPVATRLGPMQK
jgi:dynein light chain roadblock-type